MGLLQKIGDFLFGKIIKVQHPFWGEMTDEGSYYECRRIFKPLGKELEIGLEKKQAEPSEAQREFFLWLEDHFESLIDKFGHWIKEEAKGWEVDFEIENFNKEFILEYLYISDCQKTPVAWSISFYADNDLQHSCTFEMSGTEILHLLIDG